MIPFSLRYHFLLPAVCLMVSFSEVSALSSGCDLTNDFEIVGYADLPGQDLASLANTDFQTCRARCRSNTSCDFFYFSYTRGNCYIKAFKEGRGTVGVVTSKGTFQQFFHSRVTGLDLGTAGNVTTQAECQSRCANHRQCFLYQYSGTSCSLKKTGTSGEGVLGIKAARRNMMECGEKIRGVNLGGWLLLEKWMTRSLFSGAASQAEDEWTFCQALGKTACLSRLKQHWSTFVTSSDIDQIAAQGLNTIRIPIGYWSMVPLKADEPFVAGAWDYLVPIVKYAGTKGIQTWIDLHGLPGSQNNNDHSGHAGPPGGTGAWDKSQENIDRSVAAITAIAEKVAANRDLKNYVTAIQLINEPVGQSIRVLKEYYNKGFEAVKAKLPTTQVVMMDDLYQDANQHNLQDFWKRTKYWSEVVDGHLYAAFWGAEDPRAGYSRAELERYYCTTVADDVLKASRVLPYVVGEWSTGFNCPLCRQVNPSGCDCDAAGQKEWNTKWTELMMDVWEQAGGWIYWSWKTENQDVWNYQWSSANGWIPQNAGQRANTCASLGYSFKTPYEKL